MVDHWKTGISTLLPNYGCAKVGADFDQFTERVGIPIDEVDIALHQWRLCMRCATRSLKQTVKAYDYDETKNICGFYMTTGMTANTAFTLENDQGTIRRAACECDKTLAVKLLTLELNVASIDYNIDNCISYMHKGNGRCCLSDSGLYSWTHEWFGCETSEPTPGPTSKPVSY